MRWLPRCTKAVSACFPLHAMNTALQSRILCSWLLHSIPVRARPRSRNCLMPCVMKVLALLRAGDSTHGQIHLPWLLFLFHPSLPDLCYRTASSAQTLVPVALLSTWSGIARCSSLPAGVLSTLGLPHPTASGLCQHFKYLERCF